ncbi:hypothetical protein TREMEDRAFT_64023 [Tremella mesenterica DSM 1558]|uniref:uncharacterized protein n=1 Tax=Tremella mesenterica (strain ATCC 24925 / CBS 8224 / DSM 1558 / NBRC 9311 / NRRL Y-6157 / RJB 2259-6 / UBC 559-6) TaxID=578456 RepID=UPI0003F49DE0|nr:uncharacterized protein TREMEDRAFT_64023 [Tremella mesenterica DSM 1558]EIW68126.1 hypothetical protein TREMEDRAFT_64023 [Tremella mesenterica DSM 1558]
MDTTLVNADAGPSDVSQNKGGTSEPWSTRVRSAHSTCYPPQYVVRRVPRGGKKPVQDSKADSVNSQVEKIRVILFVTSDGQAEDGAPEPTLSACSPHFDSLFEQNPTTTPSQAHQTTTQVIDQSLREFVEEFFIDAFASYDYKTEAEVKTWLFNLNKIMESLNAKYATQDIKGYVLPDIPALTETHLFYPKRENPTRLGLDSQIDADAF